MYTYTIIYNEQPVSQDSNKMSVLLHCGVWQMYALFVTSLKITVCRESAKKYVKIYGKDLIYAQVPKKLANENFL